MVTCRCGHIMIPENIEESEPETIWMLWICSNCGAGIGAEGAPGEFDPIVEGVWWSDEALYQLTRLPPYVEPLVRDEVIHFANDQRQHIMTHGRMMAARNKGSVTWSPEAEKRLARVPAAVRAMAKIELERTAMDRHMPQVTVPLMEELKSRYFGMAGGRT